MTENRKSEDYIPIVDDISLSTTEELLFESSSEEDAPCRCDRCSGIAEMQLHDLDDLPELEDVPALEDIF